MWNKSLKIAAKQIRYLKESERESEIREFKSYIDHQPGLENEHGPFCEVDGQFQNLTKSINIFLEDTVDEWMLMKLDLTHLEEAGNSKGDVKHFQSREKNSTVLLIPLLQFSHRGYKSKMNSVRKAILDSTWANPEVGFFCLREEKMSLQTLKYQLQGLMVSILYLKPPQC